VADLHRLLEEGCGGHEIFIRVRLYHIFLDQRLIKPHLAIMKKPKINFPTVLHLLKFEDINHDFLLPFYRDVRHRDLKDPLIVWEVDIVHILFLSNRSVVLL
jgi:hypothetical protein